jgi:hypothetical protein
MTETIKNYVGHINDGLEKALANALHLQQHVHATEGDSDLYRKLAFYLTPSLQHWLSGPQGGSMKDLNDLLDKRDKT